MYPNLQQARSGETQHLNVRRKAINPGWRQPLLWDYFPLARHPTAIGDFPCCYEVEDLKLGTDDALNLPWGRLLALK
jgi:hypothetical protein